MSRIKLECMLIFFVLIISIIVPSNVRCTSEENYVPEEVLVFLRDVVKIDLAKYNVNPYEPAFAFREDLAKLSELSGKVVLHSLGEPSEIDIIYLLINNTLTYVAMYLRAGSPIYSQELATDMKGKITSFLEGYQAFTKDNELAIMRSMVDSIDATKNNSLFSGNLKLEVKVNSDHTTFDWKYTYNGAEYAQMSVTFENGNFRAFGDDRSYLTVGNTDVNITAQEAINIALRQAENFSYRINGEVIEDFIVVEERASAKLLTKGKDNPLILYPYWLVELPLGKDYPGFVSQFDVWLWADTGEMIEWHAIGYGGSPPATNTSETTQPQATVNPDEPLSDNTLVFVGAGAMVAIAVLAGLTAVFLNKRKNKTLTPTN